MLITFQLVKVNNKTIIELGFRSYDFKNCSDLVNVICLSFASADNNDLDLNNFRFHANLNQTIVYYQARQQSCSFQRDWLHIIYNRVYTYCRLTSVLNKSTWKELSAKGHAFTQNVCEEITQIICKKIMKRWYTFLTFYLSLATSPAKRHDESLGLVHPRRT